mgnify:CR=1 FL=1
MPNLSVQDCLREAEAKLNSTDEPRLSAIILMAHLLNKPKTWVLAYPENILSETQNQAFFALVERLAKGEPLPYITGNQSFFGLEFMVNQTVLIPRPETELLVEEALNWLRSTPKAKQILDLGTGSGCIAISLAKNSPNHQITAMDISEEALEIASKNLKMHGVDTQVSLIKANLLETFEGKADLICANLPYIPEASLAELDVKKWEPRLALDGGKDGLTLIGQMLEQSQKHLNIPALILLEIDSSTTDDALKLAKQHFPKADIRILKDMAGKERLVRIEARE